MSTCPWIRSCLSSLHLPRVAARCGYELLRLHPDSEVLLWRWHRIHPAMGLVLRPLAGPTLPAKPILNVPKAGGGHFAVIVARILRAADDESHADTGGRAPGEPTADALTIRRSL